MENKFCDPEDGTCEPAHLNSESKPIEHKNNQLIYIGDPMCSWCYGMAPELKQLRQHYNEFDFVTVVGGLRPGGGDPWNDQMKDMIAHHWKSVHERSGQEFNYDLFTRDQFNYDTEPSCRAVVAARKWVGARDLDFLEAIQVRFYQHSEDPTQDQFYEIICENFNIPFDEFLKAFHSASTRERTMEEFRLNRSWGITGYPSLIMKHSDQLYLISRGYSTFDQLKPIIEEISSLKIN